MPSLSALSTARFWRLAFLVQTLIVALIVLAYQRDWLPLTGPVGMTNQPCRDDGYPATGKLGDDWAGLCLFHMDNAKVIASGIRPKAVFIGDSITALWPDSAKSMFTDEVLNRGLGGQTSSQLLLRFEQDVIALRPAVVHILVGINDVAGLTGPVSAKMYQANIRAMVNLAEANKILVIIGTIPPAREFPWRPRLKPLPWQPILNRWLITFARDHGLILANYATVLSSSEGVIRPEFYKDGVHLNDTGYAALHQTAERALAEALLKAQ